MPTAICARVRGDKKRRGLLRYGPSTIPQTIHLPPLCAREQLSQLHSEACLTLPTPNPFAGHHGQAAPVISRPEPTLYPEEYLLRVLDLSKREIVVWGGSCQLCWLRYEHAEPACLAGWRMDTLTSVG